MRALAIMAAVAFLASCAPREANGRAPESETAAEAAAPVEVAEARPATGGEIGVPSGETGAMCGGIAAIPCVNEADFCEFAAGECKTIADVAGKCRTKPEICTMDYNPVCGCDDRTYSNACAAAAAGVSVASTGECPQAE